MNDTLQHLKNRFSCRDFKSNVPPEEKLEAIVHAGLQSPSGMNRQGWHITVINDQELINEMEIEGQLVLRNGNRGFYNQIMSKYGSIFYNAPVMFLITAPRDIISHDTAIDIGVLAQNICIAAESLDLANLHCGFVTLPFMGSKREYFRSKVEMIAKHEPVMGVLVGYANTTARPHREKPTRVTYINKE